MVTQLERMAKIETKVELLKESNSSEHKEIKKAIDGFIGGADNKYASKLTEKVVYAMAGIMLTALLLAIVSGVVAAW